MNEQKDIDDLLRGEKKVSFAEFGTSTNTRKNFPYTWDDAAFNINSFPFETDTAIIVTSCKGHLGWLKASLESYRKTGAFVILAYDNPVYIWNNIDDPIYMITHMPRPLHYMLAHSVVFKHKTYDSDKRIGWYWDVKYAQGIINGFKNIKYVYCTNGDCLIERPEGIKDLQRILGDGELISGQSTPRGTIHTADMFMTIDGFNKIMDYMTERQKYYVMGGQSPECMLRDAVDELGIKEIMADQPILPDGSIDYYCTRNLDSTWKKVLGFRNLYAEFEYLENNGLEPLQSKYLDPFMDWIYFRHEWRKSVCKYYETKDRRYLQMFWDMGKDSQEDRKFLPLEAYGKEPIVDKVPQYEM